MHDNCQAIFGRLQATAFLKFLGVKGCHSLAGTSLGPCLSVAGFLPSPRLWQYLVF